MMNAMAVITSSLMGTTIIVILRMMMRLMFKAMRMRKLKLTCNREGGFDSNDFIDGYCYDRRRSLLLITASVNGGDDNCDDIN